jgi:multidrug resistance efflux pump
LIIFVISLPGAWYYWRTHRSMPAMVMVEKSKLGDLELSVPGAQASQVKANQEVMVIPQIGGKLIKLSVEEGDYVSKGDLLAVLDPTEYEIAVRDALAALKQSQANYDQLKQQTVRQPTLTASDIKQSQASLEGTRRRFNEAQIAYDTQPQRDQMTIQQAGASLDRALANLSELQRGARSQEIAQGETEVVRAQANLDSAQADYDRYKQLYDKGYIAGMELDHAETQLRVSQSQLDAAKHKLDLLRNQTSPQSLAVGQADATRAQQALEDARLAADQNKARLLESLQSAKSDVTRAEAVLQASKARTNDVFISQKELDGAKAAVDSARTRVDSARNRMGYMFIRAPIGGNVARVLVKEGEYVTGGAVGLAAQQMQMLTIIDKTGLYVEPQIDEVDIPKVVLGQKVRLPRTGFQRRSCRDSSCGFTRPAGRRGDLHREGCVACRQGQIAAGDVCQCGDHNEAVKEGAAYIHGRSEAHRRRSQRLRYF